MADDQSKSGDSCPYCHGSGTVTVKSADGQQRQAECSCRTQPVCKNLVTKGVRCG